MEVVGAPARVARNRGQPAIGGQVPGVGEAAQVPDRDQQVQLDAGLAACEPGDELAPAKARDAWREAGAEVLVVETDGEGVGLTALMSDLGKRDVQLVVNGKQVERKRLRDGDTFVIDGGGSIRHRWVTDDALQEPAIEDALDALAALERPTGD
jgi:hypothetical protein